MLYKYLVSLKEQHLDLGSHAYVWDQLNGCGLGLHLNPHAFGPTKSIQTLISNDLKYYYYKKVIIVFRKTIITEL